MTSSHREHEFSLTYLDRFKIKHKAEGLNEPSGLAMSHNKKSLWTVSDNKNKIFNLSLHGDLNKNKCFKISDNGLEGIAIDSTGKFLVVVKEDDNVIIKIRVDTQEVVDRRPLAEMAGYDAVADYFSGGGANKGLEGIACDKKTGTIFVMKEGVPGLLVEVSRDMQTILGHQLLNDGNGFRDPEVGADDLDFSDICYDLSRDRFWITSDKAKRLFLYDWNGNRVIQSCRLAYGRNGKYREIEKAEGVAIDPDANRLYVVSDEEARLYVFDIRQ